MSRAGSGENPATAEARVNPPMPIRKSLRWPNFVTQPSADHEQDTHGEHVRRSQPLDQTLTAVEIAGDGGGRDVRDCRIDHVESVGKQHQPQDRPHPAARAACGDHARLRQASHEELLLGSVGGASSGRPLIPTTNTPGPIGHRSGSIESAVMATWMHSAARARATRSAKAATCASRSSTSTSSWPAMMIIAPPVSYTHLR